MTDWSDDVRARALELWQSDGMAAAHEATRVPKGTITGWVRKAGLEGQSHGVDRTRNATEARVAGQAAKRAQLQELFLDTAIEMVELARSAAAECMTEDKPSASTRSALGYLVKNAMTGAGISIDKHVVLERGDTVPGGVLDDPRGVIARARRRGLELLPGGTGRSTG